MSSILRRFVPVLALVCAFVFSATAFAVEAKGKVKTVNADKNEVVMVDDAGKDWTMTADKDCKVHINDKESKLSDLQADDQVRVTYEKDGDKLKVSSIKATRK